MTVSETIYQPSRIQTWYIFLLPAEWFTNWENEWFLMGYLDLFGQGCATQNPQNPEPQNPHPLLWIIVAKQVLIFKDFSWNVAYRTLFHNFLAKSRMQTHILEILLLKILWKRDSYLNTWVPPLANGVWEFTENKMVKADFATPKNVLYRTLSSQSDPSLGLFIQQSFQNPY